MTFDEEEHRDSITGDPLPEGPAAPAEMPPIDPSDIKVTGANGAPIVEDAPAAPVPDAIAEALAAQQPQNPLAGPPNSSADIAAKPDLTPTPVTGADPSASNVVPGTQFPGAGLKVSGKLATPGDAAIAADHEKIRQAELAAIQDKHDADKTNQIEVLAQAQHDADQKAADAKAIEELQKQKQEAVGAAVAEKQKAYDDWKQTPFRNLYAERSIGDRVFGALAVFLGGAGGRHNDALDILNGAMQHAYDKQAADIAHKWKAYEEKTNDVAGAAAGMNNAIADLKLLQAARWEVNAAELAKMKEKQGLSAIDAKKAVDDLGVANKAVGLKQEAVDLTRKTAEESFVPQKVKGGGLGTGNGAVTNLVRMAENGAKRSEIVDEAIRLKLPEKVWKNQVDLAFSEREKGIQHDEAGKAKKAEEDEQTEVQDFNGNRIGNTTAGRAGLTSAVESRKRAGAAQALVAQLDEAIKSVERDGTVAGAYGYGTEAYKERIRLLAGVQAKARAFSELPSSEGGLHLEHEQIGSANSASAEQLKALRQDIIDQTNIKNRSLLTSSSRAKMEQGQGGTAGELAKKPTDREAAQKELERLKNGPVHKNARPPGSRVTVKGKTYVVGDDGLSLTAAP